MEGNCGKYYYATNPGSYHELVRLMRIHKRKDNEDDQEFCTVKIPDTIMQIDWKCSHLKSNYTSIAPQLSTYFVGFKDAPIEDSLWMVLEPYNNGEDDPISSRAIVFSVIKTIAYKGAGILTSYEHCKHKDFLDFAHDTYGYSDADVGQVWNAYYADSAISVVNGAYQQYAGNSVYSLRRELNQVVKTRGLIPDAWAVRDNGEWRKVLEKATKNAIFEILNILPLSSEKVDALKGFTKDRTLTEKARDALYSVLFYEDKGMVALEDVDDPVFQSSILTFDLTLKTDLAKVKSDNPLYTLVVAKAEEDKPVAILYRRKPVEFRSSDQTGFTQQEMAKLLI